MKGFVVKLSYMVNWKPESHGRPKHYTGMRHLTSKRMISEAASTFSYYDFVNLLQPIRGAEPTSVGKT